MGLFSFLFGQKPTGTEVNSAGIDDLPIHFGEEYYDFDIVGESKYQDNLSAMCGGHCEDGHDKIVAAVLRPEPTNPYDKNAVKVEVAGLTVGYLSREDAIDYLEELADLGFRGKATTCRAKIVGGWSNDRSTGSFGVKLDLPTPLDVRRV